MLETALAQLRFAASLALGRPFHLPSLDRLVEAVLATQHEFGFVGQDGAEVLSGPILDPKTRRDMQLRRFRSQAARAGSQTRYYEGVFRGIGLDPSRVAAQDLVRVPLTPKEALREDPDAFVRRGAKPALGTMTTGTTGRPTTVYFSAAEVHAMVALSTIAFVLARQMDASDIIQISTASRAFGNLGLLGAAQRIGAVVYVTGVVDPDQALRLLSEERRLPGKKRRTSILLTYPSYLGELCEAARRGEYTREDFGLERIFLGGELATEGLKRRAAEVFGDIQYDEGYAMTETLPFGGTGCEQGHLHFEAAHGLLEVLDPDTLDPVAPGQYGRLIATPFAPFRETTLLIRYDTGDVVKPLSEPLTCTLRHQIATSPLQGKLRLSARHDRGWTYPREVAEALEALDEVPLPARYGFHAVPGGVAVEVVTRGESGMVRERVGAALEAQGVPLRELRLVGDRAQLSHPFPLRGDLREAGFVGPDPGSPH